MNKPNNYEKTQAAGDFIPIELGGHVLEIKQVLETTSKTGKPMLQISFDFAANDKQPKYFENQFRNDIRPDKKWPRQGVNYCLTEDNDGNCSRNLKTFTTSVEKSNPGFEVVWGSGFANCFKGKLVGGVFGEVQNEYQGKVSMRRELRWFRSVDKALEADVPEPKYLPNNGAPNPADTSAPDGFMQILDGIDEELPFN